MAANLPDAQAYIQTVLDSYGLGSLAGWAWDQIVLGHTADEVIQSLRTRPEYEARFPGLNGMRSSGRAVSESEWVDYERRQVAAMRQAGLPPGFYDSPEDTGRFITNNVSLDELNDRIHMAEEASLSVSAEARQQAQDFYGYNAGDLTAVFLDPDKAEPILKQRWVASQTGATANRTGYGQLTQGEAEKVGGLTQSQQEVEQGFTRLAGQAELYRPMDAGETSIGRETQLGAEFAGNAQDQQTIETRAARRKAKFSEGGGVVTGRTGLATGTSRT